MSGISAGRTVEGSLCRRLAEDFAEDFRMLEEDHDREIARFPIGTLTGREAVHGVARRPIRATSFNGVRRPGPAAPACVRDPPG
jgi:hypothetical protein